MVERLLTKGGAHWFLFQIQNHDKLDGLAVLQIPTHLHVNYNILLSLLQYDMRNTEADGDIKQ